MQPKSNQVVANNLAAATALETSLRSLYKLNQEVTVPIDLGKAVWLPALLERQVSN